jgi:hypothetical protein
LEENKMAISDELLKIAIDKLYTAVISDTLDSMGHLNQALPSNIRPLNDT